MKNKIAIISSVGMLASAIITGSSIIYGHIMKQKNHFPEYTLVTRNISRIEKSREISDLIPEIEELCKEKLLRLHTQKTDIEKTDEFTEYLRINNLEERIQVYATTGGILSTTAFYILGAIGVGKKLIDDKQEDVIDTIKLKLTPKGYEKIKVWMHNGYKPDKHVWQGASYIEWKSKTLNSELDNLYKTISLMNANIVEKFTGKDEHRIKAYLQKSFIYMLQESIIKSAENIFQANINNTLNGYFAGKYPSEWDNFVYNLNNCYKKHKFILQDGECLNDMINARLLVYQDFLRVSMDYLEKWETYKKMDWDAVPKNRDDVLRQKYGTITNNKVG
jgi:hypothetical protein